MLYLEDYLEMIENLPMEMRDKFTEMREMDLQVSNAMDSLDEKVKIFFRKCGITPNLKQEWRDEQMTKIKQEYQKALEDADEKVQLANQIYELVDRHLRKLDQELSKFKMELEADNAGITEIIEKRAAEADKASPTANNHRPEKRKYSAMVNDGVPKPMSNDRLPTSMAQTELAPREPLNRPLAAPSPVTAVFEPVPKAPAAVMSYNLGQVGSGSNAAIAVAASRAIGATLEMQQGRRTASLKASYEAVSKSVELTKELALGRELVSSSRSTALAPAADTPVPKTAGRSKKSGVRAANQQQAVAVQQQQQQQTIAPVAPELVPPLESLEIVTDESVASAWQPDPNEPRYCICNDVSYGDMVGCDNEDCPIEWFHYGCVGLTQAPRGKWYCPQCLAAMKRRGRK